MASLKVRVQKDLYEYLLQKAKTSGFKNIQRMFLTLYNDNSNYNTQKLYSLNDTETLLKSQRIEINQLISVLTGVKANCKNLKQLLINDIERFDNIGIIQIKIEQIILQLRDKTYYQFIELTRLKMLKSINQTINTKEKFLLIRMDDDMDQRLVANAILRNKTKSLIFFETLLSSKAIEKDLLSIENQVLYQARKLDLFKQNLSNILTQHSFTIDNVNSISKEYYSKKMKREDVQTTVHRTQNTMKYVEILIKELEEFVITNI
jgi:hypothetical protein